jgi:hypothetical protein
MHVRETIEGRIARLGLAVLAGVAFGVVPVRADEPRLDPNVAPTFEAVTLNLDADQETYTGSVRIDLRVAKTTRDFLFHAEEMTIDSATLEGKSGAVPITIADAGDRGTRRATSQSDLVPGDYVLSIQFSKPYNTKAVGLYRVHYEGRSYLFSQMESLDCRKAFPCWDEPIYKIAWQMTLTVPLQQEAVTKPVEKTRGATTGARVQARADVVVFAEPSRWAVRACPRLGTLRAGTHLHRERMPRVAKRRRSRPKSWPAWRTTSAPSIRTRNST